MNLTSSLHHFVDLALNVELRMFGFDTFKLDGNFFSCSNVRTLGRKLNVLFCVYHTAQSLQQKEPVLFNILYIFVRQEPNPCTWLEPHLRAPASWDGLSIAALYLLLRVGTAGWPTQKAIFTQKHVRKSLWHSTFHFYLYPLYPPANQCSCRPHSFYPLRVYQGRAIGCFCDGLMAFWSVLESPRRRRAGFSPILPPPNLRPDKPDVYLHISTVLTWTQSSPNKPPQAYQQRPSTKPGNNSLPLLFVDQTVLQLRNLPTSVFQMLGLKASDTLSPSWGQSPGQFCLCNTKYSFC